MSENKNICFLKYHKQLPAPFVIYSHDFERFTVPVSKKYGNNTEAYQENKNSRYGNRVVCSHEDKYSKPTKIFTEGMMLYIN